MKLRHQFKCLLSLCTCKCWNAIEIVWLENCTSTNCTNLCFFFLCFKDTGRRKRIVEPEYSAASKVKMETAGTREGVNQLFKETYKMPLPATIASKSDPFIYNILREILALIFYMPRTITSALRMCIITNFTLFSVFKIVFYTHE